MIEGSTITRTAQMALRLSSVNKWCVTGTPIVNDLFGLFLFLDYDPYSVNFWWKTLVYTPFCRGDIKILENLLGLFFTPIEEHFYRRQHVDSSKEIVARIRRLQNHNLKLSELDRNTIGTILRPMLKLRQSCCHPQVNTVECEESHRAHISSLNGLAGLHIINEEWKKAVEVYREVLRLVVEYEEKNQNGYSSVASHINKFIRDSRCKA
ncbi:SHPRH [Lepeophtheirus salmonis]|uniref:SHPRH n=1 Tax=Lepeophtheirus salmonis TaxID=72036 RepID=A0A7R8CBX8_LEPSM|nr:SHPRH [Lepeophtheirus salmonis]CAF2765421.1 SHPRH [Lepeophtheirus salmonis]